MALRRQLSALCGVMLMLSITACTSPKASEPAPPSTSESAAGDSCAEYQKAVYTAVKQRDVSDSKFFDLAASGEGDPVLEARRALAAGDMRFVAFSILVPGITPAAYGVECRPELRFVGEGLVRAVFAGSDVPGPEERMRAERQAADNFGHFGMVYNATLLSDPRYPYRDICRPSPQGYRPPSSATAPVPAQYGFRDLTPTDQPVDLGEAARRGTLQSMKKLIGSNRAALDKADAFGMTPLAWAIAYRRDAQIDMLLNAGADPAGPACSKMSNRISPMQIARSLRWRSLILRMRPKVPAARLESLFDEPVAYSGYRAVVDELGTSLAHRTVFTRLSVNAKGRASGCTVTRSSGDPDVDRRACAAFVRRSRWLPARGEFGEPVAGEIDQGLRGL